MANRSQRRFMKQEHAAKEAHIQALFRAGESGKKTRKRAQQLRRQANKAARQIHKQKQRLERKELFQGVPKAVLTHPEFMAFFTLLSNYQKHFIRDFDAWTWPKTDQLKGVLSKLLRHLFVRYNDLPSYMDRAWTNRNEQEIRWYLHLAKGHSIRSAPNLPVKVSKQMAVHFRQAPASCTIRMAFRWAQARALHAPAPLAKQLVQTRLGQDLSDFEFGGSFISLLVRDRHPLPLPQLQRLVSFLYQYKISGRELRQENGVLRTLAPIDPSFQLKGRSIASLLRLQEKWETIWGASVDGFSQHFFAGIANFSGVLFQKRDKIPVQIVPLTSELELVQEGQALNHCIRTYAASCQLGNSTVWRMRALGKGGRRKSFLTIQLNGKRIVQVRGQSNRMPTSEERTLLRSWAGENQLEYPG